MASIEEVITELQQLAPEDLDRVAAIIHELSNTSGPIAPMRPRVPDSVIDQAVRHGWPAKLFTQVIGSLPDLESVTRLPAEPRTDL